MLAMNCVQLNPGPLQTTQFNIIPLCVRTRQDNVTDECVYDRQEDQCITKEDLFPLLYHLRAKLRKMDAN